MSNNKIPPTDEHDSMVDAHLQSITDVLHKLYAARKAGTWQDGEAAAALQNVMSNFYRDFPPELAGNITETAAADLLADYWERVKKRKAAASTGLDKLDSALNGGFQARRLVTLLGAPGSGKTSLGNQIAERIAGTRPVLYCTSEDSPDVLNAKILARLGNVDYGDVLYGREHASAAINRAIALFADSPSARNLRYLDVSGGMISIDDLRARAETHFKGKAGPGLIVMDYLQRGARSLKESAGARDLREAVTQLTEQLRAIACSLDCCVLAIASMNRASGYNKSENLMSAAKESGDVEYSTDVLMALVDDTSAKGVPEKSYLESRLLRIDKNRQGPPTAIKLNWYASRQSFAEVGL